MTGTIPLLKELRRLSQREIFTGKEVKMSEPEGFTTAGDDLSAAHVCFQFDFLDFLFVDSESAKARSGGRPVCYGHYVVPSAGGGGHSQAKQSQT